VFVHLHSHLNGSISDCILDPAQTLAWAARTGVPAQAVTDHGCLTAVYPLYLAARSFPVRPVFGCEAYFDARQGEAPIDRMDRTHLILLAKNLKGFQNLIRINNESWTRGFRPPRYAVVTWDLLERCREGLICTTACVGGPVGIAVRGGRYERAEEIYRKLYDLFGADFRSEVAGHPIPEQAPINRAVLSYARRFAVRPVLTNDCHYATSGDWFIHNLYIKTADKKPKSFAYTATCFYLKTPAEMRAMDFPAAFSDETLRIAESCTAYEELAQRWARPFSGSRVSLFPIRRVPISPRMALADAARVLRLRDGSIGDLGSSIDSCESLVEGRRRSRGLRSFSARHPLVWQGAAGLEGLPRYVEPDLDHCVDASKEMMKFLPVRRIEGLTVIDVEAPALRQLGARVRQATRAEQRPVAALASYFAGLRHWWNDAFEPAITCFEDSVRKQGPAAACFLLAQCLSRTGRSALAKNVLRSMISVDGGFEPAAVEQARRALSALGEPAGVRDAGTWVAGGADPAGAKKQTVVVDNLPDFSALYLTGALDMESVRRTVEHVERLLESNVGVVAVVADSKADRSPLFLPLLIGLDAFLRKFRGRIYRIGRRRPGGWTDRWFPAHPSFAEVSREIPRDVALKPRASPEPAFHAHRRARTVRHSQLIRSRLRTSVLREPGGRVWRVAVAEITGDAILVAAPETRLVPDRVRVELEIGREAAVSRTPLAVEKSNADGWRISAPESWDLRPFRSGRRKLCRVAARLVSCTPGGAPGVVDAVVTELSFSGCILEGGGAFAENESVAVALGEEEIVLAAWKIRSVKGRSIWAFYDYGPAVRLRMAKAFALTE